MARLIHACAGGDRWMPLRFLLSDQRASYGGPTYSPMWDELLPQAPFHYLSWWQRLPRAGSHAYGCYYGRARAHVRVHGRGRGRGHDHDRDHDLNDHALAIGLRRCRKGGAQDEAYHEETTRPGDSVLGQRIPRSGRPWAGRRLLMEFIVSSSPPNRPQPECYNSPVTLTNRSIA